MTAKPIPAWAMKATDDSGVAQDPADRVVLARLLVATREAALREAMNAGRDAVNLCRADGEYDLRSVRERVFVGIEALIEKEPS